MFRTLRRVVLAGTLLATTQTALAVVPGTRLAAPTVTALPSAGLAKPLRTWKKLAWNPQTPGPAWSDFINRRGSGWQAAWDAATGVPSRIWGEGVAAPDSVRDAAVAERFARQLLADHLALLAPGASINDFVLASNTSDGSLRTVGFYQRASGLRVIGGQVSFRFKADRLFAIGSEALPDVQVAVPRARLTPARLRDAASARLRSELALPGAPVSQPGDESVLPLVADDSVIGYRLVRPVTINGGADGRYVGYVDVATGAVVAVRQLNTYADGTVLYHTVDRYPGRGHIDRPAPRANVTVDGTPATTTAAGMVSLPGASVQLQTTATGDLATVVNNVPDSMPATAVLPLSADQPAVWDATAVVEDDAQVNAYIQTNTANTYARTHIDPALAALDKQLTVNVNVAQNCNAYFDGESLNFFQASTACQNSALVEDVVYHEYGHSVHFAEIIPGVGDYDGAMGEGAADFFAASITRDPGMGRGFFYNDQALRDMDPPDGEATWPRDIGEIHKTGIIFAGIFWDLRKALIEELGEDTALPLVNKIYVGTLRRAVSIPTSLVEALVEDDDDGNLANGTPHECEIRNAYGRHGIRTATGTINAPGALDANALSIGVQIDLTGLSPTCTGDEVESATISWVPGYGGIPAPGTQQATRVSTTKFFAQLPLSPHETVSYKAVIKFSDGSLLTLADNYADPYYQLYQGNTIKLYCTDFETTDPFSEGWTTGADDGNPSTFAWGTPPGTGASDPHVAYSGSNILAQVLGGNYSASQRVWLNAPPINVGHYSDVRLQYRRWLASEDSHFDQAKITANGTEAWINATEDAGDNSSLQHVDKEWRFHDVALSTRFRGHQVTVGWELKSDEGLEFGGWALDDVCIVANPNSICGDGVKSATEQCDNGGANADAADVCRTDCSAPSCGDGIIDTGEECDHGTGGDEVCTPTCTIIAPDPAGCTCQSSRPSPSGLVVFGLAGVLVLRRRRRGRQSRSELNRQGAADAKVRKERWSEPMASDRPRRTSAAPR